MLGGGMQRLPPHHTLFPQFYPLVIYSSQATRSIGKLGRFRLFYWRPSLPQWNSSRKKWKFHCKSDRYRWSLRLGDSWESHWRSRNRRNDHAWPHRRLTTCHPDYDEVKCRSGLSKLLIASPDWAQKRPHLRFHGSWLVDVICGGHAANLGFLQTLSPLEVWLSFNWELSTEFSALWSPGPFSLRFQSQLDAFSALLRPTQYPFFWSIVPGGS